MPFTAQGSSGPASCSRPSLQEPGQRSLVYRANRPAGTDFITTFAGSAAIAYAMAGVADEVEAALAAAHLDELEEREEDYQAHDAGVPLDDLDAVKEAIRKQVMACTCVVHTQRMQQPTTLSLRSYQPPTHLQAYSPRK